MAVEQVGKFPVGSLVRIRERDWVVLPSEDTDIVCLRPLSGSESEICGVHREIEGHALKHAEFAPPKPEQAGDFTAGKLLRNAARLGLRNGAGPFRSLGRLSVRPREVGKVEEGDQFGRGILTGFYGRCRKPRHSRVRKNTELRGKT